MAKKSGRSSSRKMKHTRKHRAHRRHTHRRRTHRRRGGAEGAPINYHLSGSWPSRMSLGQGADYFKYHEGQHGGAGLSYGSFPGAIGAELPAPLRGPAHIGGIDAAIADVRGLCDPPAPGCTGNEQPLKGGRRRRHHRSRRHHKSRKGTRRTHRRHRRRGGALGYAPFPSTGMLLSSPKAYAQAGLNPEWKTDLAFTDAKIRDTQ
jgi:hypothetical protein